VRRWTQTHPKENAAEHCTRFTYVPTKPMHPNGLLGLVQMQHFKRKTIYVGGFQLGYFVGSQEEITLGGEKLFS
jgi:hypothetical protein